MSLLSSFTKGLKGIKVGELAPYVGGFARTHLTPGALYQRSFEHLNGPVKTQLDAGSVKPLFNCMGLLFVGAYALAWPTEYAHMKAEQAAKLEGKAAH